MRHSVAHNILIYFINNGIVRVLNIITIPIYTAFLTPSDFGLIALNAIVTSFGGIIANLGLDNFANRLEIKYFNKPEILGKSLFWIFLVNILFSCIICLALTFIPYQIYRFFYQGNSLPRFYLYLIPIWTVFIQRIIIFYQHYQINLQQASSYAKLNLVMQLSNFAVLIPGFLIFHFSLPGYMVATFAVQLLFAALIAIFWMPKIVKIDKKYARYIRVGLRYGLPLHFQGYISAIQDYLDRFLILKNISISSLGLYALSNTVANNYLMLSQSTHYALNPELYKKLDQKEFSKDTAYFYRICLFYFMVIALIGFAFSVISKEVIVILADKKFHEAYKIIPLIIAGYLFQDMNTVYNTTRVFIKNKTRFMAVVSYIAVLVKSIFLFILIPLLGIWGAAVAFVIFHLCNFVLYRWYADRTLPLESPALISCGIIVLYGLLYAVIEYAMPLGGNLSVYLSKAVGLTAATVLTIVTLKKIDVVLFQKIVAPIKGSIVQFLPLASKWR